MNMLFILNDAPYGSEKTYNALRLAMALRKSHPDTSVHVCLEVGQAAEMLGVSRTALSRVVNGHADISDVMAFRLEKADVGSAETWAKLQTAYNPTTYPTSVDARHLDRSPR